VEEVIEVTLRVTAVFEELGIGVSLASSLHGKPRATRDVDTWRPAEHPHRRPRARYHRLNGGGRQRLAEPGVVTDFG
jgi:hypothetical protein